MAPGALPGWKFHEIIRRELEEVGPHPREPVEGKPWWEHATKRFVHEEVFARERISENRDFLLSLDPAVGCTTSLAWIYGPERALSGSPAGFGGLRHVTKSGRFVLPNFRSNFASTQLNDRSKSPLTEEPSTPIVAGLTDQQIVRLW